MSFPVLNKIPPPTHEIELHGVNYPVTVYGSGDIPVFMVGMGTVMLRTLSDDFFKYFTAYACDAYWIKTQHYEGAHKLTMDDLIHDVTSMIHQLNLNKPILFGHSCFGILALAVAKDAPEKTRGVIANSTPTGWNDQVMGLTAKLFETNADAARKAFYDEKIKHFEKIKGPNESEVSLNSYERDTAKYWSDYQSVTRDYIEALFENVIADDDMSNRFWGDLLPEYDLIVNLNKLSVPVIVLGGDDDYDSAPKFLWRKLSKEQLPQHFMFADCGATGHWPNLEARKIFDKHINYWVKENLE